MSTDDTDFDLVHAGRQRSNSAPPADKPSAGELLRPSTTKALKKGRRSITVLARFRPENAQELANGGRNVIKHFPDSSTVEIKIEGKYAGEQGTEDYQFRFDRVLPSYATQSDVWQHVGEPIVDHVFSGVNCSIMAYGQTGSGKTYSMMGVVDDKNHNVTEAPGLIPRVFTGIFQRASELEMSHQVTVELNFVELYMEQLYDMLLDVKKSRSDLATAGVWGGPGSASEKLSIHNGGSGTVYINGCTTARVTDTTSAMEVVQKGLKLRSTASTSSNLQSSRSHAIVLVTLTTKDINTLVETKAQLYLVDLAGSERVAKTEASGLRLDEATSINLSLHALGNVITALAQRQISRKNAQMHIPFRNSKLTRLLENSLDGNALTFVVLTCSPNSFNDQETLSTLRFGAKAQLVTTKPKRNESRTVEELEVLLESARRENADLKTQVTLLRRQLMGSVSHGNVVHMHLGRPGTAAAETPAEKSLAAIARRNEAALTSLISSMVACPLTGHTMRDPVVALDGHTYERRAIQQHLLENGMQSPSTGEIVQMNLLVANHLMKSLISMCNDQCLLATSASGSPTAIWEVADVLGVVLDFIPASEVLRYSRINANFARAAYDKYRWKSEIARLLETATPMIKQQVATTTLPAHKVYMLLSRGTDPGAKIQALQYFSRQSIALYSSTIRSHSKKHTL